MLSLLLSESLLSFFFFNDTATTEIYTLSLHDALPILGDRPLGILDHVGSVHRLQREARSEEHTSELQSRSDLVCRLLLEKKKKDNARQVSFIDTQVIYASHFYRLCGACPAEKKPSAVAVLAPCFFFFNDTATTEIYTLSLHDALPISIISLAAATAIVQPMDEHRRWAFKV